MAEERGKVKRTQSWTRLHNATLNALSMSNLRSGASSSGGGGGGSSSSSYGGSMMAAAGAGISPSSSYTGSHAHSHHTNLHQQQQQQHPYGAFGRSTDSSRTTSPYHSRTTTPAASRRDSPASSAVDLSLPASESCSGVATPAPGPGHFVTVTYTPALPASCDDAASSTGERCYAWPVLNPVLSPLLASQYASSVSSPTPVAATSTLQGNAGAGSETAHPFETTTYVLDDQELTIVNGRVSVEQLAAWRLDIDKAIISRVAVDPHTGLVVSSTSSGSSVGGTSPGSISGAGNGRADAAAAVGSVRGLQRRMLLVRREK